MGLGGAGLAGMSRPLLAAAEPFHGAGETTYDVAIVGAGLAGMSAAQVLSRAGKRVVVLEAEGHVGGRCVSDNTTFPGVVFERGAQWFHQVLNYNPLYELARTQGLEPTEDTAGLQVWRGSTYDAAGTKTIERLYGEVSDALESSGTRTYTGHADVSGAVALQNAGITGRPWSKLAEALIGPLTAGTEFERSSAFDLGNFSEALSGDNYLLRSGMGNFVATFAKGLDINLNTVVTSIEYGKRGGARLRTNRGTVNAALVIVTVSMGVLAAETIVFSPALPAEYHKAIGELPMGVFAKIALGFDLDVFGTVEPNTNVVQAIDSEETPAVIAKLWGSNVGVVYLGGENAIALDDRGATAAREYALATVAQSFPKAKRFNASAYTSWYKNPFTRGSYTIAKPGGAPSRRTLAVPLGGNQLYFAGEALSMHSYGTLSAAYQSGVATAKAILGIPSIVSVRPDRESKEPAHA